MATNDSNDDDDDDNNNNNTSSSSSSSSSTHNKNGNNHRNDSKTLKTKPVLSKAWAELSPAYCMQGKEGRQTIHEPLDM